MRLSVPGALLLFFAAAGFMQGCDRGDILIDDQTMVISSDTSVRVMNAVLDSSRIAINTTDTWRAFVAKGGGSWCLLNKTRGEAGHDTLKLMVTENPTDSARRTSVILESGTRRIVFKIVQNAGEAWFVTDYWHRTALQRAGYRGKVQSVTATNSKRPNKTYIYNFDPAGNLLSREVHDVDYNRFDTTHVYTYDAQNHMTSCVVTTGSDSTLIDTVRSYVLEYNNPGKLVAYSANRWDDPHPLEEGLEGAVLPDLSQVTRDWSDEAYRYHEVREYSFDEMTGTLVIDCTLSTYTLDTGELDNETNRTDRIEYRKGRPYNSRYVVQTTYYNNGMIHTLSYPDGKYEYGLENHHRMVPTRYYHTGAQEHAIDSCVYRYNYNRDIEERLIYYSGYQGATIETYGPYRYDNSHHNWEEMIEYIPKAGQTESHPRKLTRAFTYY